MKKNTKNRAIGSKMNQKYKIENVNRIAFEVEIQYCLILRTIYLSDSLIHLFVLKREGQKIQLKLKNKRSAQLL